MAKRKRRRKIRADQQNGRTEEKIEIAKNLINIGMKVEDIIKVTGLSKEEVENLIKENKKLN